MRKEPFSKNDYVHIYNRGNRKQLIVHDTKDKERFLEMLYYFNTEETPANPFYELRKLRLNLNRLVWPDNWKPRKPIIDIFTFILMPNHFHLLIKETKENGAIKFMQRIGTGMTMYYNIKYQESGTLFQGSYKARCVDNDLYLKYLSVYIQVKNTLELYPGGVKKAVMEFDKAYDWAIGYLYSSLGDFVGTRSYGITTKGIFSELFSNPREYKEFARDCLLNMDLNDTLGDRVLET